MEAAGCRPQLWALCLPFSFLLWSLPATGMEATASPSPAPALPCAAFTKRTCEECVKNTKCLWCGENDTCMDYPVSKLIPPSSVCELKDSYWGICFVNFEAIIITIGVVAGLLLLLTVCCCCYCCRRRRPSRKHERKVKHDEIRKKYGLLPDSDHPYSRYENE
ncbi:PTTG1IP family member 2 isoform X2 [Sceloporus undulatus]|uniref:PTTG1IP family member 2 isoform X2 n=1 Tax=Sceloporus undulatus TaxID=8520 RepID=UPI001C4AAEA0|nr:PTTG1IP family member 2 isoform X2 [Sceloporus undulatus]